MTITCSKDVHCQILKLKLEPQHPQHCITKVNVSYIFIALNKEEGAGWGKEMYSIRDSLEEQQ